MKKLEIVEFLKGYSIFTIVVYHFLQKVDLPDPLNHYISFGGTGVHLFVLLSGFGLFLSHLKKPLNFIPFIKKRMSKIYIPYILVIILSALISFVLPIYQNSLYDVGGHVFLYKMFDENIIGSYGYPLWFISMIIQFYIIFIPLTILYHKLRGIHFVGVGLVISLLWIEVVFILDKESLRVWNSFFLQFMWEFVLGMYLASKYIKLEKEFTLDFSPILTLLAGITGCVVYAFLAMKGGDVGRLFNDIPALIGYTSIAIFIYQLKVRVVNDFFLFTGRISFSIYLLHFLIMSIALFAATKLSVNTILFLSIAMLVTYLLSYYYQKIILRLYRMMGI